MSKSILINKYKKGVEKIVKEISKDIDFDSLESNTERKQAIQTKKMGFVSAKKMTAGILDLDYKQQEWSRGIINSLINAGERAINILIEDMDSDISSSNTIKGDGSDIKNAIDSKYLAFQDTLEIQEHVDELKKIIKEDEIVLREAEFNEGFPEKYADKYINMKNKSGYKSHIDAVVIDPEGTIGEIIEIMDIRIALPKKPARKTILNEKRKKVDQKWRRQPPPKSLTKKSAKGYEDFIDEEYDRKRRGFWFYNKGIAEYVTGSHWFMLNHCQTTAESKYYWFSKAQQKLFLFMEAVWCDERSGGLIFEKIRRFGATDCFLAFKLSKAITERDMIYGLTSKKDSDAKKIFRRLSNMFVGLPFYFKPIVINSKGVDKIDFSAPTGKTTKKNKDKDLVDNSLNTYMNYEATSEDSYDQDAVRLYMGDEFSKWKKQNGNTYTHFDMIRKSITKGARITGKIFLLSTVENVTGKDALNDDDAKAGDRYKWLYYNSNPNKRDANGRTRTYLYKIFISSYEHYEGFIDEYGYAITEDPVRPVKTFDGYERSIGIKTFLNNEMAAFEGNLKAMIEYLRKTPIKEDDGFAVSDGTCMFNQGRIITQLSYNSTMFEETGQTPTDMLRRGNFEWLNGVRDCGKVVWRDNPNGRFLVSWLPDEELANRVKYHGRVIMPGNSDIGAFGIDSYRVSKTVDGKGSKGAMHGLTKGNPVVMSNTFFLEYLARPDNIETFFDDMIMAMVHYGMPALIENNVNNLLVEMQKRGYRQYSLNRPDKPYDKLSYDEKKYGGIPSTSENVIQMQTSAIESYIDDHVGEVELDDGFYYGDMPFDNTLTDWLSYDPKNRTKRDASISSSLAIIACNSRPQKEENLSIKTEAVQCFVKRFNNSGRFGTQIKS